MARPGADGGVGMEDGRMSDYPKHLARNKRHWKAMKRKQIAAVLANFGPLDRLLCGCAYTPGHDEICQAVDLLREAQEKMRVKNWGR